MHYTYERSRAQRLTAEALIRRAFGERPGALDAEFLSARRDAALGFSGLPYAAPVCRALLNVPAVAAFLDGFSGSQLDRKSVV